MFGFLWADSRSLRLSSLSLSRARARSVARRTQPAHVGAGQGPAGRDARGGVLPGARSRRPAARPAGSGDPVIGSHPSDSLGIVGPRRHQSR